MTDKSTSPPPLTLIIPPELEPKYINSVRIAHSPSELLFDFAHFLPGKSPAQVSFQMVMSPLGAKLFYRALGENLARFEKSFGEIRVPGEKSLADHLFHSPPQDEPPKE
jgi:hypothetical protein